MDKQRTTVFLSKELARKAKAFAVMNGVTLSNLVEQALERIIKESKKEKSK